MLANIRPPFSAVHRAYSSAGAIPARAGRRRRLHYRVDDDEVRRFAVERGLEVLAEVRDVHRGDAECLAQVSEVRALEIDAERRLAGVALVVPEHPVAAVVDDYDRHRQALLGHGRELAAGEEDAAVAVDADRADARGCRAHRGGEAEPERAPAHRIEQLSWLRERVKGGDPITGDAHVGGDDGVVGKGVREGVEEGELLWVLRAQPFQRSCAQRARVGPWASA